MDSSVVEEDGFKRNDRCYPSSPHPPSIIIDQDMDLSGHITPPACTSVSLKNYLGLVSTPLSPCSKVCSSKIRGTPIALSKSVLEPPTFSSTPACSPCSFRTSRSLKVPRQKIRFDFKDKLNVCVNQVPSSLINPFSPYRTTKEDSKSKKSKIERKKIIFGKDDEENCDEPLCQSFIKKPRLSDFSCHKFDKEFIVLSMLGSGDHGCVYKCLHLLTGMIYAVKRSLRPINNEKMARNEIFAHAALEHPYIVRNYVSWSEDDYVFMQNEYCNKGSLEDHIKNNGPLQEKELMVLLEHLSQGLRYIHKCNLAHMDIKPGNIFLSTGPELYYKHHAHCSHDDSKDIIYKIGDLGHVVKLDDTGDVEDGDCRYLPREMLNESHIDYSKVDIFALGLTLYEAAGGGPLPKNGDEWHQIRDGKINFFSHLSTQFNNMLKRMINEDPKKRPTTCELLDEICGEEISKERDLMAANQKIHFLQYQLDSIYKSVSKSVNANTLRTSSYKKQASTKKNSNVEISKIPVPITERCTRSASRLVAKKYPKVLSFH